MKRSIACKRRQFFAVHQGESVADVLGAAGAADPVHVIFRMLRHVVIDDVTDAGDVDPARGDVGRDHDFVFAALETFERLDAFALGAVRMQHRDGMLAPVSTGARCDRRRVWSGEKIRALSKFVRSSKAMSRSNFCSAATG